MLNYDAALILDNVPIQRSQTIRRYRLCRKITQNQATNSFRRRSSAPNKTSKKVSLEKRKFIPVLLFVRQQLSRQFIPTRDSFQESTADEAAIHADHGIPAVQRPARSPSSNDNSDVRPIIHRQPNQQSGQQPWQAAPEMTTIYSSRPA